MPDRAKRFENRTAVERFASDLKENHGGHFIFVRGGRKVHTHLMFGVLSIFALRILQILQPATSLPEPSAQSGASHHA